MKYTIFNLRLTFIAVLFGAIIFSCENNFELENTPDGVEEVTYDFGDGEIINVTLDPNFNHGSYSFSNLEEHDSYLIAMESKGQLVVNKKMYQDLIHYYDPYQIAVLDQNYTVTVGDEVFKATPEASYKKSIKGGDWEMHIYYGLSGEEDLKETELVFMNKQNLDVIKDYQFKSPASKEIYDSFVNGDNPSTEGRTEDIVNLNDENGQAYLVKYRDCRTCIVKTAYIRWVVWRENYRSWGGKAKGGTYTQISRESNPRNEWRNLVGTSPVGAYHENGTKDTSAPYTRVRVSAKKTKDEPKNEWSVSVSKVKRKNGRSASSQHWAKFRENNNSASTERLNGYSL